MLSSAEMMPASHAQQMFDTQWWPAKQCGSGWNWDVDTTASGGSGSPEPLDQPEVKDSFEPEFQKTALEASLNDNTMKFPPMSAWAPMQTYDAHPLKGIVDAGQNPVQGYFDPVNGLWSVSNDLPASSLNRESTKQIATQNTDRSVLHDVKAGKGMDAQHLLWDSDSDNERKLKLTRSGVKCVTNKAPGAHRKKETWAILSPSPTFQDERTIPLEPLHDDQEHASEARVIQVMNTIPNFWCDIQGSKTLKTVGKGVEPEIANIFEEYAGSPEFVDELYRELNGEVSLEVLTSLDKGGILQQIPRGTDGVLTSVGSIGHKPGSSFEDCRPCIFWYKDLCKKGLQCLFCHFSHGGQKAKRIRASKKTRMRLKGRGEESENKSDAATEAFVLGMDAHTPIFKL